MDGVEVLTTTLKLENIIKLALMALHMAIKFWELQKPKSYLILDLKYDPYKIIYLK